MEFDPLLEPLDVTADDIKEGWNNTRIDGMTRCGGCALAVAAQRRWPDVSAVQVGSDAIWAGTNKIAVLSTEAITFIRRFDTAEFPSQLPAPVSVAIYHPWVRR